MLLLVTLGFELPLEFVGLGWLLLGIALYEIGLAKRLKDFAMQGYFAGGAGVLMLLAKNVIDTRLHSDWHGWVPQLCGAIVLYALAVSVSYPRRDLKREDSAVRDLAALTGTILTAAFLANTLPDSLTAAGWAALGLALLAIGTRVENTGLRLQSYALAVLTFGRTWAVNFDLDGVIRRSPVEDPHHRRRRRQFLRGGTACAPCATRSGSPRALLIRMASGGAARSAAPPRGIRATADRRMGHPGIGLAFRRVPPAGARRCVSPVSSCCWCAF